MLSTLNIMAKLDHFTAVDIVEIDEKSALIHCKHEIASEWLKGDESSLRKRPTLK
jgi:hypothetical protein